MTDYSTLIPDARAFYTALDADNTRDWWQANRNAYDTKLKPVALSLIDDMISPLSELADTPVTGKLFRPHRDVRFSKDKRPYNTHLHMMWSLEGDAPQMPVFFFGIGLDYITAGLGIRGFDKPVLEDWRKFADLDTKRIRGIIDKVEAAGFALEEPALKRIPPAYEKDHPAGDLLRMKGVTAMRQMPEETVLPDDLVASFRAGWPLNALLIQIAES